MRELSLPKIKKIKIDYLIIAYIWISQIYYSYRYIFKINSTGTSPTYADTPLFLKAFKYILLMGFFLLVLLIINYKEVCKKMATKYAIYGNRRFLLVLGLFFAFIALKIIIVKDIAIAVKVLPFLVFSLMVLLVDNKERFIDLLIINFKYVLYFHILYSIIQILAYKLTGRLPALAYSGGLVRFGGGYDDPNGFGMFLLLPIIYLCVKNFILEKVNIKNLIFLSILILLEILTWGFTCLALLVLILGLTYLYYVIFKVKSVKRKIFIIIITILFTLSIIFIFKDTFIEVINHKLGSINVHLSEVNIINEFKNFSFIEILFGSYRNYYMMENYIKQFILNYGLTGVSFLIYIIYILIKCLRTMIKLKDYIYVIGLIYVFTFLIGNLNLPFMKVYPINIIFFIILVLILDKYKINQGRI